MKKQMTALLSCVALGLMLVTASVFATETFNPKIYQVFVDDDGLMTIVGTGFPDGAYVQTLKVGGSPVDPGTILYDADNDTIQGSLGDIPPGDYRLLVNLKKGNVKKNMIWDLTIGAEGPQGVQGKVGPPGEDGEDGGAGASCPCAPVWTAAFGAHLTADTASFFCRLKPASGGVVLEATSAHGSNAPVTGTDMNSFNEGTGILRGCSTRHANAFPTALVETVIPTSEAEFGACNDYLATLTQGAGCIDETVP